jgi:hypothetical protein
MDRVAARSPVAVGLKVTEIVQVPLATTLLHVFAETEKSRGSVPPTVALSDVIVEPVVLVRVTVSGLLVFPTPVSGKVNVVADWPTPIPVPVKTKLCGLLAALSVTTSEPTSEPTSVGV